MSNYLRITPGGVELYSHLQLRRDNPDVGFPADPSDEELATYGVFRYTIDPEPAVTATQVAEKNALPTEFPDGWRLAWTVRDKTAAELEEDRAEHRRRVNNERDRRLEGDFLFQGKLYQRDSKSLDRITGAGSLAGFFMAAGGDPTSLKWHATEDDPNPDDFGWIASDNTVTPMDAATTFAFARAAARVETFLVFKAKALRALDPIPADFDETDDSWWLP